MAISFGSYPNLYVKTASSTPIQIDTGTSAYHYDLVPASLKGLSDGGCIIAYHSRYGTSTDDGSVSMIIKRLNSSGEVVKAISNNRNYPNSGFWKSTSTIRHNLVITKSNYVFYVGSISTYDSGKYGCNESHIVGLNLTDNTQITSIKLNDNTGDVIPFFGYDSTSDTLYVLQPISSTQLNLYVIKSETTVLASATPTVISVSSGSGAKGHPEQVVNATTGRLYFADGTYLTLPLDVIALQINANDVWKKIESVYVNVNGVWKKAESVSVNVNGSWKKA